MSVMMINCLEHCYLLLYIHFFQFQCCKCCCQKAGEIKETRIGYLPPNVLDGSIALEAEDGNNNDVKILSVQKASPDSKYSTLIKPREKISIKSLITANIGIRARNY